MSNPTLRNLAIQVHAMVQSSPDQSHGFDDDDVMAAVVLLHAIVMDVGAPYLLPTLGQENANKFSYKWGANLHKQIFSMTGVDTYKHKFPGVR